MSLLEFEEKTHITNQRWANSVLMNTNTNVNIIRLLKNDRIRISLGLEKSTEYEYWGIIRIF